MRPDVPATESTWPRSEIDHFILQRLTSESLSPAADTDRRTWLRRVTIQLTGLPPTPDDYRAFETDRSDLAFERVVDRLLGSHAYAETWTRHWLDLVRYAESYGHEFDYPMEQAYRYRDYLLRAFQDDVSYRQIITEHLAGDLLTPPRIHPATQTNESVLATGFWHFGEATHAPTDAIADRADRIDNQIDVFSKAFLGLTIACARCHDHKFDPISTEDYYSLVGVLKSSRRHQAALDQGGAIRAATGQLEQWAEKAQARLVEVVRTQSAGWFAEQLLHNPDWQVGLADPALVSHQHPLHLWRIASEAEDVPDALKRQTESAHVPTRNAVSRQDEGFPFGWLVHGAAFENHTTVPRPVSTTAAGGVRGPAQGVLPQGVSSRRVSERLHGVLRSPSFTLPRGGVHLLLRSQDVDIRLVIEANNLAWHNPLLFEHLRLVGDESSTGGEFQWRHLENALHEGQTAYLECIDQGDGYFDLAEVRLGTPPPDGSGQALTTAVDVDGVQDLATLAQRYGRAYVQAVAAWRANKATNWQSALIDWTLQPGILQDDTLAEIRRVFAEIEQTLPSPQYALALTDGPGEESYVSMRGDHRQRGKLTARRWPLALAGESQAAITAGSGRALLAERLFAAESPFPARVAVNRVWHHLFGRGLVSTVDDFGPMGQPASHPELLDWLADDFIRHDWSIKSLIRQIVLSRTYRMSSAANPIASRRDPDNRWLHRMPVRRLTAESLRDQLLFLSGSLNEQFGGPSVPVHLTSFMQGRGRPESGPLDGGGRRSVYLSVRRNFLSPFLLAFDFPIPAGTRGRRNLSNEPAQALMLLNDPFVMDQAQRWATRLLSTTSRRENRYRLMTEQAWGKPPTPAQTAAFDAFLSAPSHEAGMAEELQDWSALCHTIINTKDFLFVR